VAVAQRLRVHQHCRRRFHTPRGWQGPTLLRTTRMHLSTFDPQAI
jgi:hypothetical protein